MTDARAIVLLRDSWRRRGGQPAPARRTPEDRAALERAAEKFEKSGRQRDAANLFEKLL